MRVSVLDQSIIAEGQAPRDAVRGTLAMAEACEALGYFRFWVSEHHNNREIAGSAPEVLLGAIAARTTRMRIGSAGVMLPHYAPLKIAEQFSVLESLAPGRVDLGLGRGPGADRQASYALKPGSLDNPFAMSSMDNFANDVGDVIAWSSGTALDPEHPFAGVVAQPSGPTAPEHWIVGSSPYTAHLAAHYGLPYCFAHFFHDGEGAEEALSIYRAEFQPSARLAKPHAAICVWAVAAPTMTEAEELFADYALVRLRRDRVRAEGQGGVTDFPAAESAAVDKLRSRSFFGTADKTAARLTSLCGKLEAEELVIVTTTNDPADRLRSYELFATAFGLPSDLSFEKSRELFQ
jgi:luciferase family oxidoreductase group 1